MSEENNTTPELGLINIGGGAFCRVKKVTVVCDITDADGNMLEKDGFTQSPDVSLIDRTALEGEAPWWTAFGAFAYLYVPREAQGDEEALRVLMWHLQNSKDAPVRREGEDVASAINLGFAFGEGCFFLDMLLADEKAFHRTLRILAPEYRYLRLRQIKQLGHYRGNPTEVYRTTLAA